MSQSVQRRIQIGHLILQEPSYDHAEQCFKNVKSDADVSRYTCWQRHQSVEQTQTYLQNVALQWQQGAAFTWGVYPHGSQCQGIVSITPVAEDPSSADVSFSLAKDYWGYGITGKLLHVVEQWLSQNTDIYALNAYCHTDNEASQKVLQRAGYIRKARLKDYAVFPNLGDTAQDCYFYHKHLYASD